LARPLVAELPATLADAASLPDRVVAVTAKVNLHDKTLIKVILETGTEESVELLENLAFKALNWGGKCYPDFRPTLLKGIPAGVAQPCPGDHRSGLRRIQSPRRENGSSSGWKSRRVSTPRRRIS